MRLVTWNLNARRNVDRQVAAIAARAPDVVALQEITAGTVLRLRTALPDIGLTHMLDSFAASPPWTATGPRRYGLLIASRVPLTTAPHAHRVVWPERLLSAQLAWPTHELTVHVTHIPPGSSNKGRKVEMLEAVLAVVADSAAPCLLCGDFNLPQAETPEGRIVTWAERMKPGGKPRLRSRRFGIDGRRWDRAERLVMEGGPPPALVDAYRALHGYGREDFSWYVRRGPRLVGRRFDHAFCSPSLRILQCEYPARRTGARSERSLRVAAGFRPLRRTGLMRLHRVRPRRGAESLGSDRRRAQRAEVTISDGPARAYLYLKEYPLVPRSKTRSAHVLTRARVCRDPAEPGRPPRRRRRQSASAM